MTTEPATPEAVGPDIEPTSVCGRQTYTRYVVLAVLCAGATLAYVHRNSLGACEVVIRADLGLSKTQMGLVMSSFFFTYALFQLPTGWLGHVLGTRRGLTWFVGLWSAATATIGMAFGMPALVGSRLAMGAAQSGLFPCCTQTVALWFPPTRRGLPTGALGAFQSVGGALGLALTGWLVGKLLWDWRTVYIVYALPGLVGALAFYAWFRDRPEDHPSVNALELRAIRGPIVGDVEPAPISLPVEPTPWMALLKSGPMWAICGQQVFRAAGYIFFASWFTTYLIEAHRRDLSRSGFLASLPLWAVFAGQMVGGWISDAILMRTGSRALARKWLAVASMLGCAGCVVWALHARSTDWCVVAIVAGAFVGAIGAPCSYAITIDMGGRHIPMVFSIMNMAGNVGAIGFPILVPWVLEQTGSWDVPVALFGLMYVGAAFCWLALDPRGNVYERDARLTLS